MFNKKLTMKLKSILAAALAVSMLFTGNDAALISNAEEADATEVIAEDADVLYSADDPNIMGFLTDEEVENFNEYHALNSYPVKRDREVERLDKTLEHNLADVGTPESLPSVYIKSLDNIMPLRSQGDYGTCWSHGFMACAEKYAVEKFGADPNTVNYSEMAFAYYVNREFPEDPLGNIKDNNHQREEFWATGNNLFFASNVAMAWVGPSDESFAPYSSMPWIKMDEWNNVTSFDESVTLPTHGGIAYNDELHLRNYYEINIADVDEIKRQIMDKGIVGISYCEDGLYHREDKEAGEDYFYNDSKEGSNHTVAVVGWDDTISRDNFAKVVEAKTYNEETDEYENKYAYYKNAPEGDGAWLIRNSWVEGGAEHSRRGYFWLSYYDTTAEEIFAYEFDETDNYDHNYQYDGGALTEILTTDDVAKMANRFTAKACDDGEILRAVSFDTKNANLKYTVEVYLDSDAKNPENGLKIAEATTEGMTRTEGYYTVELGEPVYLKKGDTYSVVVTLEKEGSKVNIPVETEKRRWGDDFWYVSEVVCESGQSFVCGQDDNSWIDMTTFDKNNTAEVFGNVRIKAYTDNATEPVVREDRIRYVLEGGKNSEDNPVFIKDIDPSKELSPATRYNYVFDGWFEDENFENPVTQIPAGVKAGYTLYAKWSPRYSIIFDGNDATSGIMQSMDLCEFDEEYILPKNQFKKKGLVFAGWSTDSDAEYVDYRDEDSFEIDASEFEEDEEKEVVLYAVWVKANKKYVIEYAGLDGGKTSSPKNHKVNNKPVKFKGATRKGYIFKGWYDDEYLITPITELPAKSNYDYRVYASWEPITYNIEFNANGGEGNMKVMSVDYDEYFVLPNNKFTNGDKTFVGWSTKKKGKVIYKDKNIIRNLANKNGKKITLYAVWE